MSNCKTNVDIMNSQKFAIQNKDAVTNQYIFNIDQMTGNISPTQEENSATVKSTCFVIMPFSATTEKHTESYWDSFFEVIKREIELQGFACTRSETGPYHMVKHIIEKIHDSDIVIAVLTDMNPNVWYELGIRHSLKNGTLMLLENGQQIPFDISSYGLIKYSDGISLANTLAKEIHLYINKLNENIHFDSPVMDYLNLSASHDSKIDKIYKLVLKIANEKSENQYNAQEKPNVKHNRILWVDDYPTNNESVIALFQNQNIQFDIALTTDQGIEFIANNKYDLIITDMGRGSEVDAGLQLIRYMKQLDIESIPPVAVFASYNAVEKYGNEAMRLGAIAAINGFSDIISLISQVLGVKS
ncbi:MAG: response regulator [Oscillospiraceae bacterium]|nr:response regulator [Oscillospiraceae bacterium]